MGGAGTAAAAEFQAAISHKGYGGCHMDSCTFFIIDRATTIGGGRDGTPFEIEERVWDAEYKPPAENAPATTRSSTSQTPIISRSASAIIPAQRWWRRAGHDGAARHTEVTW